MSPAMAVKGTILIVDDNVDILGFLSQVLSEEGYVVHSALSGNIALKAIETSLPDLILLDIRMPDMDGYAVSRHLKVDPRTREIPIIFVSAEQDMSARIEAFKVGGVDYIAKPFSIDEVLARVHTHLSLVRHRYNLEQRVLQRTQELRDSEAHLYQLSVFLQGVREEDRAHFARELHDELGQNLTALRIDFNGLAAMLGTKTTSVVAQLESINKMIDSTVDSVRRICEDLRPGMLDDLGLEAALNNYTKRFSKLCNVACDLSMDRDDYGLSEPISTAIFRIVQESLTNIARHSKATNALIDLVDRGDDLVLTIADDGCGLPEEYTGERKTYGLLGIRERVHLLGGQVSFDSKPGRGTHIEVVIPRQKEKYS